MALQRWAIHSKQSLSLAFTVKDGCNSLLIFYKESYRHGIYPLFLLYSNFYLLFCLRYNTSRLSNFINLGNTSIQFIIFPHSSKGKCILNGHLLLCLSMHVTVKYDLGKDKQEDRGLRGKWVSDKHHKTRTNEGSWECLVPVCSHWFNVYHFHLKMVLASFHTLSENLSLKKYFSCQKYKHGQDGNPFLFVLFLLNIT